jgi:hypothetical protein
MTIVTTSVVSGGKETVKSVDKVSSSGNITNISKGTNAAVRRSTSSGSSNAPSPSSSSGKTIGQLRSEGYSFSQISDIGAGKSVGAPVERQVITAPAGMSSSSMSSSMSTMSIAPKTSASPSMVPGGMSSPEKSILGIIPTSQAPMSKFQDTFAKSLLTTNLTGGVNTTTQGTSVPSFAIPKSFQQMKEEQTEKAVGQIITAGTKAGLTPTQASELAVSYSQKNPVENVLGSTLFVEKTSKIAPGLVERSTLKSGFGLDTTAKSDVTKGLSFGLSTVKTTPTVADVKLTEAKLTVDRPIEDVRAEVKDFERAQAEMQSVNRAQAQYENTKIRQAELNNRIDKFNNKSPLDRDPMEKKQLDEERKAIEQQFSMNPYVTKTGEGSYQFSAEYAVPKTPESQQTATAKFNEGEVSAFSVGRKSTTAGTDTTEEQYLAGQKGLGSTLAAGVGRGLGAVESGFRQVTPMFQTTEQGRGAVGTAVQKITGIEDAETARVLGELGTKSVGYAALGGVAGAAGKGIGSLAGSARLGAGAGATTGTVGKTLGATGRVVSSLATPAQVAYAGIGAYESGKAASEGYKEGGAFRGLVTGLREAQKYVGADYVLTKGITGAGIGYSEKLAQRGAEVSQAKNLDISQGKTKGVLVQVEGQPTFVEQVKGGGTIRAKAGDIFEQKVPYTFDFQGAGQPITDVKLITAGDVRVLPKGEYQNEFILRGKSIVGTPETTFSRNVISNIKTNPETQRTLTRSVLSKEGAKTRELQETRSLREGQNIFTQGRTTRVTEKGKPQEMGFFASSTTVQEPRILMAGDDTLQTTSFATQEVGVTGGGKAIDDMLGNLASRSPLTDYSGLPTVELTTGRAGTKTVDVTKATEEGATVATKPEGTMDVLKKVSVEPKAPKVPSGSEDNIRVIRGSGPRQVQVTREAETLQSTRQQPSFTQSGSAQEVKSIIGQRGRVVDFTKPYRAEGQYISKTLAQAQNLVKVPVLGRSLAEQETRMNNMSRLQLQPQTQQSRTTRTFDTAQETKLITDIGQAQEQLPESIKTQDTGSIIKQTSDTTPIGLLAPVALAPFFGGGGGFNVGGFGRGFSGFSGERVNVGSSIKVNPLQELELGKNFEKFL